MLPQRLRKPWSAVEEVEELRTLLFFDALIPVKPLETSEVHEPFASGIVQLRTEPLPQ